MTLSAQAALTNAIFESDTCSKFRGRKPEEKMIKLIHRVTVEKILEYVDAKVESGCRIDIESLAAYSGYSRRHLQRLFLAETGGVYPAPVYEGLQYIQ